MKDSQVFGLGGLIIVAASLCAPTVLRLVFGFLLGGIMLLIAASQCN